MIRRALLLAVAALALVAAPARAAASFNDIENQVMCVSCNVALSVAESPQAEQERTEIHKMIARGMTKQQILDRLVADYGPNVLAEPKKSGFGLLAWLVPIAAALALLALGLVVLPRWRRARREAAAEEDTAAAAVALDPSDAARIDADMARLGM